MRTLLLGVDFMYNKDGDLIPIEVNTNVGWDGTGIIENYSKADKDYSEILDLSELESFIVEQGFIKIVYIGTLSVVDIEISKIATKLNLEYQLERVRLDSITIPFIEDNDTTLIIRSAYDTTAIVDDTYCKDKVNYLDLIKNQQFGPEFAYIDYSTNTLVNTIVTLVDNGNHPNFILKYRYPSYDKKVYPKLFKATTQEELNTIIQNNVTSDYFLMPFYLNENKLYQGNITVTRVLSLLLPPDLTSMFLGSYTKPSDLSILGLVPTYNSDTFELNKELRGAYLVQGNGFTSPKLSDEDLIEMADGTFKTAEDLQVGDEVLTINIPNPENTDLENESANFNINYDTLISGSSYSTNKVTHKVRVNRLTSVLKLTFTDGTDWYDTANSSYLTDVDGDIRFTKIELLSVGDKLVLVDSNNTSSVDYVQKTINTIEIVKEIFSGWDITVERQHMFLTVSQPELLATDPSQKPTSYVAIEHNSIPCDIGPFTSCISFFSGCPKATPTCYYGTCVGFLCL
jgi:hypothetical protein